MRKTLVARIAPFVKKTILNAEESVQHTPTPDKLPKNLKETLESNLAKEWRATAYSEYLSLVENDTCDLGSPWRQLGHRFWVLITRWKRYMWLSDFTTK